MHKLTPEEQCETSQKAEINYDIRDQFVCFLALHARVVCVFVA